MALVLGLDGGGTQSTVEWQSFLRCIPERATCCDLASGLAINHYRRPLRLCLLRVFDREEGERTDPCPEEIPAEWSKASTGLTCALRGYVNPLYSSGSS